MDKPPYPILCNCCKLPAFYVFEKQPELSTTVYCPTCTYQMASLYQNVLHSDRFKKQNNLIEDYNALRRLQSDDYVLLTFILNSDALAREFLFSLINKS